MNDITRCPECGTHFRITTTQLDAHDGLVRCGHCRAIFDAREHLHTDTPSPQLNLPLDAELPAERCDLTPVSVLELEKEAPGTLAEQVQFIEEPTGEVPPVRTHNWSGNLLAGVLGIMLLAQAAYYFRTELAARLPGLRPLIEQSCEQLGCTVGLPQKIDLMVLDSSELEFHPTLPNIITLHALVHNRAPYPQDYPCLELTLTDLEDQPIARRQFHPADYLKPGADPKTGVPPNRDLDIRLHLDTTNLKPLGYRLLLFYPPAGR